MREEKPNYKRFVPFILRWEGGEVNDPDDRGGHTNMGITRGTFNMLAKRVLGIRPTTENFRSMTHEDAEAFIAYYWNKATNNNTISTQKVSEAITSWRWGSGTLGMKNWQRMLNAHFGKKLRVDGRIGKLSVAATNSVDPDELFNTALQEREAFFRGIASRSKSQRKFLRGWLNRLNDFKKRWE